MMVRILFFAALILLPVELTSAVSVRVNLQGKPLVAHEVKLIRFLGDKFESSTIRKTDDQGIASFPLTKEPRDIVFETSYQGLEYFSEIHAAQNLPKAPIDLPVYASTEKTAALQIQDLRLFISEDPRGGLKIEESLVVENPSNKAIIGFTKEKEREVFHMSFPESVFDLVYGSGFEDAKTRNPSQDLVIGRPILPGLHFFNLTYSVEAKKATYRLNQTYSIPIKHLSLVSDLPNLKVVSTPLLSKSVEKYFDGKLVSVLESQPQANRHEFEILFSNLPTHFDYSLLLAPLLLLIGLLLTRKFKKASKPSSNRNKKLAETQRNELLQNLAELKELRAQGLLSILEYDRRRIDIFDQLWIFYEGR